MPRAEKSTEELKKDLERARLKYEQSLSRDNKKIADLVHKYYGEELDTDRLEEHFKKVCSYYAALIQQGKVAGTQAGVKKAGNTSEQVRSSDEPGSGIPG